MKITKYPWLLAFAAALSILLVLPAPALAQGLTTLDEVTGATNMDTDASMRIFGHIIGDHLKNPFSALAAPSTLFGKLFLTLNTFVFLVGVLFASYGIGAGIVQTAHEGQVLGRRMSAIWMPIRMVTGIAGMIPFFGGFSLAQAVMMLASLLGIGLANFGWNQVINEFDSFSGMVRPAVGEAVKSNSPLGLSYGIFSSEVCRLAREDSQRELGNPGPDASEVLVRHRGSNGVLPSQAVYGWGKPNSVLGGTDSYCGRMEVKSLKSQQDLGGYRASVSFGFTVGSVNYAAISNAIRNGIHGATTNLATGVAPLAQNWYAAWKSSRDLGGSSAVQPPALPTEQIEALAGVFASSLGNAGRAAQPDVGAITEDAKAAMTKFGWFGAGAWYSTLAQGQTAMTDAFQSVEITVVDPTSQMVEEKVSYNSLERDAMSAYLKLLGERTKNGGNGDNFSLAFGTVGDISNDTGNWSLGQSIVSMTLKAVGAGSGGGTYVNPIIMLKNTGDYLMSGVQAAYFGGSVLEMVPAIGASKKLSKVGDVLSGMVSKADPDSKSDSFMSKIGGLGMMLMGAIFAVGALMSVYIPFIPFVAWMGGIVQYVTIFFEGLIAAPIWAFAHLDADGEGMGQRAERGYIFILNMLFRPFLMILGFLLAAGLLVVMGTFQMVMFMPAMANVQGNSITGAASILLLLGIFCMLNITLIHGLFNLITLIPDQVLGWVGNMGNTQLGKEVEEKAHAMFVNLGRGMSGAMGVPTKGPNKGKIGAGGPGDKSGNGSPGEAPKRGRSDAS